MQARLLHMSNDMFFQIAPIIGEVPHVIPQLDTIFNIEDGKYIKENSYWKSYNINTLIDELKSNNKNKLTVSFNEIKEKYIDLSKKYQSSKEKSSIPLK